MAVTGTQTTKDRVLGLPRNIFFLGLTSLFNDFSSEIIFSVIPAFFVAVLKAGAVSLGLVDGIAESASNFIKIFSGHLSDCFQKRKPLVVAGYSLSVITRPFYTTVGTVGGALGLRVLDRLWKGSRDAPRDATISLSSSKEETERAFGYHHAMDTTGAIFGPLVAYLILRALPGDFNVVFFTAFVIGIIALATLIFISDVVLTATPRRLGLLAAFHEVSLQFKRFLICIFILSAGALPMAVLLLKTSSLGLVIADIPLFYMIYNVSYAAFSFSAGKLSDRVGAKIEIACGYLLLVAGYAVLGVAASFWSRMAGFFILGFFPAFTDGVQRSIAAQLTGAELRGDALGLLNAANGFGLLAAI